MGRSRTENEMLSAMAAEILRNNHAHDVETLRVAVERTDRRHERWRVEKERRQFAGRGNNDTKKEAHLDRLKYGKLGPASPVRGYTGAGETPIAENSAPE